MRRVSWVGVWLLATGGAAMAQPTPPSFDDLDTDATGTLSPEEVGALLAGLPGRSPGDGATSRGPSLERIFGRWDADGDGAVTREEFDARPRMGRGGPRGPGYERERPRPPVVL